MCPETLFILPHKCHTSLSHVLFPLFLILCRLTPILCICPILCVLPAVLLSLSPVLCSPNPYPLYPIWLPFFVYVPSYVSCLLSSFLRHLYYVPLAPIHCPLTCTLFPDLIPCPLSSVPSTIPLYRYSVSCLLYFVFYVAFTLSPIPYPIFSVPMGSLPQYSFPCSLCCLLCLLSDIS